MDALAPQAMPPGPAPSKDGVAIRVAGINHYFGTGDGRSQVLFDNTIDIDRGQLIIMTGPSGSGKTTLLTLIGALRTVQEGSITIRDQPLQNRSANDLMRIRRGVGFIFQMHNLFESLTARENVMMALDLAGLPRPEMRERAKLMLGRVGLDHRVDHYPDALSGGQRQRVAVARALVNRPKIVLADEPTAARFTRVPDCVGKGYRPPNWTCYEFASTGACRLTAPYSKPGPRS